MTDDLAKRLREEWTPIYGGCVGTMFEAADRIEQLEKGFRDILKSNDDALIISVIARACLHGFIDAQGKYCYVPFSAMGEKKDD